MNSDQSDTETMNSQPNVEFDTLSYSQMIFSAPDSVTNRAENEYRENAEEIDQFLKNRDAVAVTPRTVRWAMAWTVVTIKTDTRRIDARTEMMTGNFRDMKKFVENSTDGQVKWEKVHTWFTSSIPERVAGRIRSGDVYGAHALLAGRDPETGEELENLHYLRTCKASLVLYLLGIDRMCIDSRIYRTAKPLLEQMLEGGARHPDTDGYRDESPNAKAKYVPVVSHSGDQEREFTKTFLEDKLKWHPEEYHAITHTIRQLIRADTGIPEGAVPQVLFNCGGESTFHEDLYEIIG